MKLYLNTLYDTLPRLIEREQPDFLFYVSGVDILASDRLGKLSVSREGCEAAGHSSCLSRLFSTMLAHRCIDGWGVFAPPDRYCGSSLQYLSAGNASVFLIRLYLC